MFSYLKDINYLYIIICIIVAWAVSYSTYYKNKELNKLKLLFLKSLRFMYVLVILFLLIGAHIKGTKLINKKPKIIFVQDNSKSLLASKDSTYYKNDYKNNVSQFLKAISSKYEIINYSFGSELTDSLTYSFNQNLSNYSHAFKEIKKRHFSDNIGSVILAGDGLYNKGFNPVYQLRDNPFKVYTLKLGDTIQTPDAKIKEIYKNKIVFINNKFYVRLISQFDNIKSDTYTIKIYKQGEILYTKTEKLDADNKSLDILLEANKKGLQKYTCIISVKDQETNLKNNKQSFYINVIDSKKKILIVNDSPNPDIAALSRVFKNDKSIELTTIRSQKFRNVNKYNLLIVSTIENTFKEKLIVQEALKQKIPILFFYNSDTNEYIQNFINQFLSIRKYYNSTNNEIKSSYNKKFNLFNLSDSTKLIIHNFPPLVAPYAEYKFASDNKVLLFQNINNVKSNNPQILFHHINTNKIGVIIGEGIWRWRINNFVQTNTHKNFDELVYKLVNYLMLKLKKDKLFVNYEKVVNEDVNVEIKAELYNDSFEQITSEKVVLELKGKDKKLYQYSFIVKDNYYYVNLGKLQEGEYSFNIKTKINKKTFIKRGKFVVKIINNELNNTVANWTILEDLSKTTNANSYHNINKLENEILNTNLKTVIEEKIEYLNILDKKIMMFLILFLISLELFLRKFWGEI